MRFVEIDETFDLVGVAVALAILFEEADRSIKRMDNDLSRFTTLGRLECGIESPQEILSVFHAIGAQHEIEPRRPNQIKTREIMTSSQNTTNTNVTALLLAEAIQQCFQRTGTTRTVRIAIGGADIFRLGDELEPGIAGVKLRL